MADKKKKKKKKNGNSADSGIDSPMATLMANQPPTMSALANVESHPGDNVVFSASATDPDGDPLTFSLVGGPSGSSVDPNTGEFTWTPGWSDLGNHIVTIKVTDPGGASDQESCTVEVANAAPQIEPLADQTVHPTETLNFWVNAVDPDGDTITLEMLSGPTGAVFNASTGEFNWTPAWSDVGSQLATFRATDPGGDYDQDSCVITVANAAPQIDALANQTVHPGNGVLFSASAFDADGDQITFSLVTAPTGATIDASTGEFAWTPGWSDLGVHSVTIKASDPGGASSQASCTISVTNQPPQIEPIANQDAHPTQELAFAVSAYDPDNDAIAYSLVSAPTGATINASNGDFSWTPGWSDLGSHSVTVKVTDPGGASVQASFTITVANQPPQLEPLEDQTTSPGMEVSFTAQATDPDGDALLYELIQAPAGATLNGSTGYFSWLPGNGDLGIHTVTIKVSDSVSSVQSSCSITVMN